MSSEFVIRRAELPDLETIVEFNSQLARETEGKELNRATLTDGVGRLLEHPTYGHYFVATYDGIVVGQVMHTHEWSDWRNGDIWWLQSVYVHPNFRRQGVFRRLLQHMTQLAREANDVVALRLYMEIDNAPAQETYTNLGFSDPGYKVFEMQF